MRLITLFLIVLVQMGQAQTWNSTVGAIIYKKCSSCHYTGGIGPFSLRSYQEAVNHKYDIQSAITAKRMPPWPADPNYKRYAHENFLYESEIQAINNWVNNSTPEGTGASPVPPPIVEGPQLGTPDQSIVIPTYASPATNHDVYQSFAFRSGLTQDKFLNGLEIIPGNRSIVHHVIIYKDMSNDAIVADSLYLGPGYRTQGGGPSNSSTTMIGAWAPGVSPVQYPANMGIKIEANTNYIVEIHYPKGSVGQLDSTRINMHFNEDPNVRELNVAFIITHTSQEVRPFFIPANEVKTYHDKFPANFPVDFSLLSVFPHMHLLGQTFKIFATKPNTDTLPLINIKKWDFNWQYNYFFKRPQIIKSGSSIEGIAVYDNTTNNPNNPNNPPQLVTAGEETTQEMMIGGFTFMLYQQGDENILISSDTMHHDTLALTAIDEQNTESKNTFQMYPNPSTGEVYIAFKTLFDGSIKLYDVYGKLVHQEDVQTTSKSINLNHLSNGLYYLRSESKKETSNSKVLIISR